MNITEIAEHSIALDLLPRQAKILDIGCRGFGLLKYFDKIDHNHTIFCIDADPQIKDVPPACNFFRLAISDNDGECGVSHTNDPQATHIMEGTGTMKMTIESFKELIGVPFFDLIKIDIEGEEYNVLKNSKHPIAKQVSVEFHAHCRPEQTKEVLDKLLDELSEYYEIHNRNWESRHCAGFNYWDVLLIKKGING